MQESDKSPNCIICETEIIGNYCHYCGYPVELKRIDRNYILREVGSVLNFDRGILYTVKELFIRPGQNIRRFIAEERNRLVKPIIFVIVCSLVYTIVQHITKFEDGYINFSGEGWKNLVVERIFQWISQNYGYVNIMISLFTAFWVKLFFRKHHYNYFEIVVLLCFVTGISMLIFTFFGVMESLTKLPVLQIGANIGFLYTTWAIASFYDKRKVINYIKAVLSSVLGLISFMLTVLFLGIAVNFILP